MADQEHLYILQQGVAAWNDWRQNHPEIPPNLQRTAQHRWDHPLRKADYTKINLQNVNLSGLDLTKAHLPGANLNGADLTRCFLDQANLHKAHLKRAKLHRASLRRTNLSSADFTEADISLSGLAAANLNQSCLQRADLHGSNLLRADMTDAVLRGANLRWANFHWTIMNGAVLEDAILSQTIFASTNLADVLGLERVQHQGPSAIDLATFLRSEGRIPDTFLRGAGVPESFIQYLSDLRATPFQFYSCFISYSSKDQEFADRLYTDLQSKAVRCWFASEDLKIGEKFRIRIDESIRLHDKLLLVLSEHSVSSDWVEKEVETAMERERQEKRTVLFPIRLDDSVMDIPNGWPADIRRTRHIGDFTKWKSHDHYQKAFDRLLRDLKADQKPRPTA